MEKTEFEGSYQEAKEILKKWTRRTYAFFIIAMIVVVLWGYTPLGKITHPWTMLLLFFAFSISAIASLIMMSIKTMKYRNLREIGISQEWIDD